MEQDNSAGKTQKFVTYLSIAFAILFIGGVIIVKSTVPSFSVTKMLVSIGFIVIFFGSVIFIWHLIEKNKELKKEKDEEKKKQPEAITIDQARDIALNAVTNVHYADYIDKILWDASEELGKGTKSNVYTLCGVGYFVKEKYYVIINMHFPEKKRAILIDPTDHQLRRAQQLCATYPEAEPNFREITTENVLTGNRQTIKEKVEEDKEVKKESKEEEKADI